MSQTFTQFVGREREITWLKVAWALARRGNPQVCVLRGESGFGKTRVVQAFYSLLSKDAEQNPHGYWPDSLLQEGSNLRINPTASDFTASVPIPWLWWGARWSDPDPSIHNRGELSSCALIDSLVHLEPHRQALLARREYLARAQKAALDVASALADLSSLGWFSTTKSLVETIQFWREEKRAQVQESRTVEQRQAAALQAQIDSLCDFVRFLLETSAANPKPIPILLVLDDAQWIDTRSLSVIERLLTSAAQRNWPLMMVATHWEREWNLQSAETAGRTFPGVYGRLAEDAAHGRIALSLGVRDIDRLEGLAELVRDRLPGLTVEQIGFLCERADGNPRLLNEMLLELSGEPAYFEGEDSKRALDANAFAALRAKSFALHDVQGRRFRQLGEGLQRILGYASFQGMRFLRSLVLDVARIVDEHDAGNAQHATLLASAEQPYAIVVADGVATYEFRHRVFHELAAARIARFPKFTRELRPALLLVAADWLNAGRLEALSPVEKEQFYLLMLEQLGGDVPAERLPLRLLAGVCVLYANAGQFGKVLEFADRLIGELPFDGRVDTAVISAADQRETVGLLLATHKYEAAKRLARGLVDSCLAALENPVGQAALLADLAAAYAELSDVQWTTDDARPACASMEKAIETYREIGDQFGATTVLALTRSQAQVQLGAMILRLDDPERARQLTESALATFEDAIAVLGETPGTLRSLALGQLSLGDVLVRLDRPHDARELYEKSVATRERSAVLFGDTSESLDDIAVAKARLGNLLLDLDQPAVARKLYEDALALHRRIAAEHGERPRSAAAVTAIKNRVADALRAGNELQQAYDLYVALLKQGEQDLARFGEGSTRLRSVAVSHHRVGRMLLDAGHLDDARAHYDQALLLCERALERFDETAERMEDLSIAVEHVGDLWKAAGNVSEARLAHERALEIRERTVARFGATAARLMSIVASHQRIMDTFARGDDFGRGVLLGDKGLALAERVIAEFGARAARLQNLAGMAVAMGDLTVRSGAGSPLAYYQRAFAVAMEAMEIDESMDAMQNLAGAAARMGAVLTEAGELGDAQAAYNVDLLSCQQIIHEFGETAERTRNVAFARLMLGVLAYRTDDAVMAREHLGLSQRLFERVAETTGPDAVSDELMQVRALLAEIGSGENTTPK